MSAIFLIVKGFPELEINIIIVITIIIIIKIIVLIINRMNNLNE